MQSKSSSDQFLNPNEQNKMAKRKAPDDANSPNEHIKVSILSEKLSKLYLNGNTADVHFVAKDENGLMERIPAHKF